MLNHDAKIEKRLETWKMLKPARELSEVSDVVALAISVARWVSAIMTGWIFCFCCLLLLMAEIPNNHLGWCCNPINNGKNYLATGAGFQPSTVPF